ncbi:DNA internalization-related competence protein ComEC/Rec2 [Vibrio tubiashii]|uniref:DNA internalization-related competence protein ComEC/Rec2 n=2 Tax=Vibrio tubiashii TaxID=29498 RepID=A0AAE5LHM3_9VIBR|nr:DNA internalization-related competence protein ComEC/Rec2 [Vibrio tubiashii]
MHGNLLRYQTEALFQAGQDITIIADVDSLFKPINFGFQGIVVVRSINGEALTTFHQPKLRLTSSISLNPGDQVTASISVKPIYGLMNGVGYDAEQHALIQGVVGTGSVDRNKSFFITSQPSLRTRLIESVKEKTQFLEHQAMILALMFGMREGLTQQHWELLKSSGLSHLIAISGLHVGIAFAIGWFIGFSLLKLHVLFLHAPVLLGLAFAIGYAWLAGFSIPTERAVTMCLLLCILMPLAGQLPNSFKWLLVLSLLLFLDPFSAISSSLWMSMVAVGVIFLYQASGKIRGNLVVQAVRIQLFLVFLMAPIVMYLFHGVSLGAIAYNLVFVPWFTVLVIPLVFFSFASHFIFPWFEFPWQLLELSLGPVNWAMEYSIWTWFDVSRQTLLWLLYILVVLTISRLLSRRVTTLLMLSTGLSLVEWRNSPLWQIVVLDVGHGLSILVQQQNRALVYDTGAAWQTSSMAEQVVTPLMISRGITQLDYLAISHFDNDHAGGWQAIKQQWSPSKILTSQSGESFEPCLVGRSWQWGKITIESLWPPKLTSRAYNPHSCVFKLQHQESSTRLLLAGDIESIAEWILVREGEKLDSDILIVPHHGSKTSSIPAFIAAVSPEVAVASLAKGGRWKLPDENVVERYQKAGAKWLDTGHSGQVLFDVYPQSYQVSALRTRKGKTWYRQMLRNGVE